MDKIRYRSVFVSDTHFGFRGAQSAKFLEFIKHIDCDYLYFVGDTFDLWSIQRKFYWDAATNGVIRKILKMAQKGVQVTLIAGNHDEGLRDFLPCDFGQIAVRESTVHITTRGERWLVIHGDQFDFVIVRLKWLAKLGTVAYDFLLTLSHWLTKIRNTFRLPFWSLAAWAKNRTKRAISVIRDFEDAAIHAAELQSCVGVICGHIHTPKIRVGDNGIVYANCGDWVESCTALVETDDGEMEIVYL